MEPAKVEGGGYVTAAVAGQFRGPEV